MKLFTVLIRCLATFFGHRRAIYVAAWPFMWLYKLSVAMLALNRKKSGEGTTDVVLRAVGVGELSQLHSGPRLCPGHFRQQIDMRLVVPSGAAMQLVVEGAMSSKLYSRATVSYAGVAAAACIMMAATNPAIAGAGLVPHKAISIPPAFNGGTNAGGVSSFDISFVDPGAHTYILGDRTNNGVDVIDTRTNTLVRIAGQGLFKGVVAVCAVANSCSGPNGVLIVNATTDSSGNITGGEIWAGDAGAGLTSGPGCVSPSQCSSVKVLDLRTGALKNNINTGGQFRTDEMCFDPKDNVVMATNNADSPPYATVFDASTKAIVAIIPFVNNTNGAEQCQYNPRTGLFYQTAPEQGGPGDNSFPGAVVVVDPKIAIAQNFAGSGTPPGPGVGNTIPVVANYVIPLSACDGPQGMAIGPEPQILIGCNGGPASAQSSDASIVINDGSTGGTPGSVIAELPNQDGPDMVDFNPSSRLYTLAKSTKTLTNLVGNIGMVSSVTFAADTNISTVATSGGAHSVASDPGSRSTYVPIPIASAASHLCSSVGGVDATGCILQMTRSITNTHDFDANTASDVLFRDTSGNVAMWQLTLGTGAIQTSSTIGNVPLLWSIIGQRDFAGNGFSSILWRDTSGNLAMWQMNGPTIQGVTTYDPVPSTFQVAGTGEYNANGMGDILFEDNAGNLFISFMNGSQITSTQFLAKLPSGWVIAGTDRRAAIFLRNTTTGDVGVWVLQGTKIAQGVDLGPVSMNWTIAGIGDFDGNGSSDILFTDTSGNVGIWLMETDPNLVKILSTKVLGTVPPQWSVAHTGDYSGNGKADILWIDNTGNVAAWFMNGTTISSVVNYGNIGTTFAIQSLNSE